MDIEFKQEDIGDPAPLSSRPKRKAGDEANARNKVIAEKTKAWLENGDVGGFIAPSDAGDTSFTSKTVKNQFQASASTTKKAASVNSRLDDSSESGDSTPTPTNAHSHKRVAKSTKFLETTSPISKASPPHKSTAPLEEFDSSSDLSPPPSSIEEVDFETAFPVFEDSPLRSDTAQIEDSDDSSDLSLSPSLMEEVEFETAYPVSEDSLLRSDTAQIEDSDDSSELSLPPSLMEEVEFETAYPVSEDSLLRSDTAQIEDSDDSSEVSSPSPSSDQVESEVVSEGFPFQIGTTPVKNLGESSETSSTTLSPEQVVFSLTNTPIFATPPEAMADHHSTDTSQVREGNLATPPEQMTDQDSTGISQVNEVSFATPPKQMAAQDSVKVSQKETAKSATHAEDEPAKALVLISKYLADRPAAPSEDELTREVDLVSPIAGEAFVTATEYEESVADTQEPKASAKSVTHSKVKNVPAKVSRSPESKPIAVPRPPAMPPSIYNGQNVFPRFIKANVYIELRQGDPRYTYRLESTVLKEMSKWFEGALQRGKVTEPDSKIATQWGKDNGGLTHVFDLEYDPSRELWALRKTTRSLRKSEEIPRKFMLNEGQMSHVHSGSDIDVPGDSVVLESAGSDGIYAAGFDGQPEFQVVSTTNSAGNGVSSSKESPKRPISAFQGEQNDGAKQTSKRQRQVDHSDSNDVEILDEAPVEFGNNDIANIMKTLAKVKDNAGTHIYEGATTSNGDVSNAVSQGADEDLAIISSSEFSKGHRNTASQEFAASFRRGPPDYLLDAFRNIFRSYNQVRIEISADSLELAAHQVELYFNLGTCYGLPSSIIEHIRADLRVRLKKFPTITYHIKNDPWRWLYLSMFLRCANIFKEAVIHLVGQESHFPVAKARYVSVTTDVELMISRKVVELGTRKEIVNAALLSLAATAGNNTPLEQVAAEHCWYDWYNREVQAICSSRAVGHNTDALMYRAIAGGNDAYLSKVDGKAQGSFGKLRKDKFERQKFNSHLYGMKKRAQEIVRDLVKSESSIPDSLPYLTCTTVGDDELPWMREDFHSFFSCVGEAYQ